MKLEDIILTKTSQTKKDIIPFKCLIQNKTNGLTGKKIGGCQRWGMGLRQNGLSQKVPTVSYKINKSWGVGDAGGSGWIAGSTRSPEGGNGDPLQWVRLMCCIHYS